MSSSRYGASDLQAISAEEPEGGNLQIRIWRGLGLATARATRPKLRAVTGTAMAIWVFGRPVITRRYTPIRGDAGCAPQDFKITDALFVASSARRIDARYDLGRSRRWRRHGQSNLDSHCAPAVRHYSTTVQHLKKIDSGFASLHLLHCTLRADPQRQAAIRFAIRGGESCVAVARSASK